MAWCTRWATTIAAFALLAGMLPLSVVPAFACSCFEGTPEHQASRADNVFTGTAVSITLTHARAPLFSSDDPLEAVFQVETVYKGRLTDLADVRTVASSASCGYEFQRGQRYTVFAQSRDGALSTHMCSGNVKGGIDPARYNLLAGVPPEPSAPQRLPVTGRGTTAELAAAQDSPVSPWVPLTIGLGLLSVLGGFLLWRRERPWFACRPD